MNRIIKFRIWDKVSKSYVNPNLFIFTNKFQDSLGLNHIFNPINCPEYIIQEFTNLVDVNGKEIYEGDICIDNSGEIYHVEFFKDVWGTAFRLNQFKKGWFFGGDVSKQIKVIGNMFENPELLK